MCLSPLEECRWARRCICAWCVERRGQSNFSIDVSAGFIEAGFRGGLWCYYTFRKSTHETRVSWDYVNSVYTNQLTTFWGDFAGNQPHLPQCNGEERPSLFLHSQVHSATWILRKEKENRNETNSSFLSIFWILTGNPVSSTVTFYLFVLPTLRKMAGWQVPQLTTISAKVGKAVKMERGMLKQDFTYYVWNSYSFLFHAMRSGLLLAVQAQGVAHKLYFHLTLFLLLSTLNTHTHTQLSSTVPLDSRPEYHRATLQWGDSDPLPIASSTGSQCSSRLLSMRTASALLVLPPKTEQEDKLEAGTIVKAMLIGHTLWR